MQQAIMEAGREVPAEISEVTNSMAIDVYQELEAQEAIHAKHVENEQQTAKAEIETEKLLGKLSRISQRTVRAQAILLVSMIAGLMMLVPSLLPSALALGNNSVHQNVQSVNSSHAIGRGELR